MGIMFWFQVMERQKIYNVQQCFSFIQYLEELVNDLSSDVEEKSITPLNFENEVNYETISEDGIDKVTITILVLGIKFWQQTVEKQSINDLNHCKVIINYLKHSIHAGQKLEVQQSETLPLHTIIKTEEPYSVSDDLILQRNDIPQSEKMDRVEDSMQRIEDDFDTFNDDHIDDIDDVENEEKFVTPKILKRNIFSDDQEEHEDNDDEDRMLENRIENAINYNFQLGTDVDDEEKKRLKAILKANIYTEILKEKLRRQMKPQKLHLSTFDEMIFKIVFKEIEKVKCVNKEILEKSREIENVKRFPSEISPPKKSMVQSEISPPKKSMVKSEILPPKKSNLDKNGKFDKDGKGPALCDYCDEIMTSVSAASQHVGQHHKDKILEFEKKYRIYSCSLCDRVYYTVKTLFDHYRRNHKKNPKKVSEYAYKKFEGAKCIECNKSFRRKDMYNDHMEEHKVGLGTKLYSCNNCDMKFHYRVTLVRHQRFEKESTSTLCIKCGVTFENICEMRKHRHSNKTKCKDEVNTRDNRFFKEPTKCSYCDLVFTSRVKRNTHMWNAHDHKAEFCDICGKKCNGKYDLAKHVEVHNEGLSYLCKYCGKKFKSKQNMTRHTMQVHEDYNLNFKCQQCGRGFQSNSLLSDHMNVHLGLKPYRCEFCGTGFQNKSNLLAHKKKTCKAN